MRGGAEDASPSPRAAPVSILVCSKNRRPALEDLVARLARQDYPGPTEIVVVEETDSPAPIEGTRYVPIPVRDLGIAHARNLAVGEATHDLIAFIDDDAVPRPSWLRELMRSFDDPEVDGVAGAVVLPPSGAVGRAEHILGFPGGGLKYRHRSGGETRPTVFISTLNAGYRKAAVLEAGGFPEGALFAGEDQLLAERVCSGGRCRFVPDAIVEHPARGSWSAVARWFFNRGRSAAVLVDRLGRWHVGRMLLLPKLLVAGLLGAALAGWPGTFAGVALYFLISWLNVLWAHRFALDYEEMGAAGWLMTAPVRTVMDCSFDAGFYHQMIFRRERT